VARGKVEVEYRCNKIVVEFAAEKRAIIKTIIYANTVFTDIKIQGAAEKRETIKTIQTLRFVAFPATEYDVFSD
jgi:hypothetical protein